MKNNPLLSTLVRPFDRAFRHQVLTRTTFVWVHPKFVSLL